MKQNGWLLWLTGVYCAVYVACNVVTSKLIEYFGVTVSAGTIAFGATFLITDVVSELWGKRTARQLIYIGFLGNGLALLVVVTAVYAQPAPFYQDQEAYALILGQVPRMVLASWITYLASQLHDVWAFDFWRQKTEGRHLWLRNNLSTMVSQAIDATLFTLLAFYGTMSWGAMLSTIWGTYVVKLAVAAADTPLVYALVGMIRARSSGAYPVSAEGDEAH